AAEGGRVLGRWGRIGAAPAEGGAGREPRRDDEGLDVLGDLHVALLWFHAPSDAGGWRTRPGRRARRRPGAPPPPYRIRAGRAGAPPRRDQGAPAPTARGPMRGRRADLA